MDKKLLEALSARAEQRDEAKRKGAKFYVAGEELDFVQPGVDVKLSYAEALNSGDTAALLRSCANVIYDCCPALQEPELHAALGVTDPYDTVWKLMEPYEIDQLGGKLARPHRREGRGTDGGSRKKLVMRDPVLDLAAFYAPRGIPPDAVRAMSLADRAVLRVGRARYYEEMRWMTAAGVAAAFTPQEEEENEDG